MRKILENTNNIMAFGVVVLFVVAGFKLWQESRNGKDKS